jgi:hypothetical protein
MNGKMLSTFFPIRQGRIMHLLDKTLTAGQHVFAPAGSIENCLSFDGRVNSR